MSSLTTPTPLPIPLPPDYRLAILQTDSLATQFQTRHVDYPEMFVQLLSTAGVDAAQVDSFDARQESLPEPNAYLGYLITGSKHSVYDDEQWIPKLAEFVGAAMRAGSKVVGICFGHQLLAHFFGGQVTPANNGWAVGVHENAVLCQMPWMQPYAASLSLLSSHQDQVQALPLGATLIASTAHCPIAGFVIGDTALGLQSHPEFSPAYAADLMNSRAQALGPKVLEEGLASLACPQNSEVVARWILHFLLAGEVAGPKC